MIFFNICEKQILKWKHDFFILTRWVISHVAYATVQTLKFVFFSIFKSLKADTVVPSPSLKGMVPGEQYLQGEATEQGNPDSRKDTPSIGTRV